MIIPLPPEASFGQRLKFLMDKQGLNSIDMGKILNKTSATVRHWCNDKAFPRSDNLQGMSSLLNVTMIDLFPESAKHREKIVKEELRNNIDKYKNYIPNVVFPSSIRSIPIDKGYHSVSNDILTDKTLKNETEVYIDIRMVKEQYKDKELKAMIAIGDSMTPYISHGDIAIYYPTNKPLGTAKYVINTLYGLEVKSITFLSTGQISIKTENPSFENELLESSKINTIDFVGLVVGRILKS